MELNDCRLLSQAPYGQQWDLMSRHGHQWLEKRHSERREEMQRLLVLWQLRSSGSNISVTEDVIQLFKQVARTIHYCFTPLLFLPKWRLQVARTRDPNLASVSNCSQQENNFHKYLLTPQSVIHFNRSIFFIFILIFLIFYWFFNFEFIFKILNSFFNFEFVF